MIFRRDSQIMSRVWCDPRKTSVHDVKSDDGLVIICTDGVTVLAVETISVTDKTWAALVETVPPRPAKRDDDFEAFIADMVVFAAEGSEVSVSAVELCYGAWCEIRGIDSSNRATRKTIVKMLGKRGAKAVIVDGRVTIRGVTLRERSTE